MKRNYEDLTYVRLFDIRSDVEWEMFPWEARATWPNLKAWVDRAGVIDLHGYGMAFLAKKIQLPEEVVSVGVRALADREWVRVADELLVIPDHIKQETAKTNDRARQQKTRETRLAEALRATVTGRDTAPKDNPPKPKGKRKGKVTGRDESVTGRDSSSRGVTNGHVNGQKVTLSLSLSQDLYKQAQPPDSALSDPAVPADPDFLSPPPPAFPEKRFLSGSKPVVNVKGRKKASKAFDAIPPRAGEEEGKKAWDSKNWEELEGEISAGFFLGWWRASRLAPEREPANFEEFWKRVEKAKCANRKILFAALKYQTQTTGAVAAPDRPLAVFILDSVWPQRIEEEPPPVPKCSFPGCTAKGRGSIVARWDKLLCYPHARLEDEKDVAAAEFAKQEAICDVRH